jgi:uncharacterized membrane protein
LHSDVPNITPIFVNSLQVLSLVTFICSVVYYQPFTAMGGGWVQFVAITAFMVTAVLYLIHLFKMVPKFTDKIPFKFTVSKCDEVNNET